MSHLLYFQYVALNSDFKRVPTILPTTYGCSALEISHSLTNYATKSMFVTSELQHVVPERKEFFLSCQLPTIFHITHYKAGSQWIHRIFHAIAYHRLVLPDVEQSQFYLKPIQQGMIYPTIYATRQEFQSVELPAYHRRFVVIRDLRDTLISFAFSLLYSHNEEAAAPGFIAEFRASFLNLPFEDALIHLIEFSLSRLAEIQESWLNQGEVVLRYEDLLNGDVELLANTFIRHCQLDISQTELIEILVANRFESITGGRKRGNENIMAHERKGVAGDWRNHFTKRVTRAFKDRYNDVLIAAGYEDDSSW